MDKTTKVYDKLKKFMLDYGFFILGLILIYVVFFVIKVPYEIDMSGGVASLSGRIIVDGKTVETEGSFNMAYVNGAQGSLPHYLLSYIIPDWERVPLAPDGTEEETVKDANKRNNAYLEQSKSSAIAAALNAANKEYSIENVSYMIVYLLKGANTDLMVGDQILEIDGKIVDDASIIKETIANKKVDDIVNIKVLRDDKEVTCQAKLFDLDGKVGIGMTSLMMFDVDTDLDIVIDTKKREGGPSGGMMMSLMIYNGITNQDLTKGRKIVGTGTISIDGTVGAIGGVKYKVMGAYKNKADVFFVPKDNYEEAMKVNEEKKYNLNIVSVNTLEDAIKYLEE